MYLGRGKKAALCSYGKAGMGSWKISLSIGAVNVDLDKVALTRLPNRLSLLNDREKGDVIMVLGYIKQMTWSREKAA